MKTPGPKKGVASTLLKVSAAVGIVICILAIMIVIAPFIKRDTPTSTLTATSNFCKDSSDETIRTKILYWKERYQNRNPQFVNVGAGSLCELSDGTKLVSFLFTKNDGGRRSMGQSIALYDNLNNFVRETDSLWQKTGGDYDYPHLKSVEKGFARFTFSGGDAGMFDRYEYSLDLSNFEYTLIDSKITQVRYNSNTGVIEEVEI